MKANSLSVRCVAPVLRLADPAYNAATMRGHMHIAFAEGVRLLLFPELSLTGATIEDLFYQSTLINAASTNCVLLPPRLPLARTWSL